MNLSALAFVFSTSAAVPVGFHHSYFLQPVLPKKLRTYSIHVESGLVVPTGFTFSSFTMFRSVNQPFMDLMKSWKSSYCYVEFQSNVGVMGRDEGLGASALRDAVSAAKGSADAGGLGMTAKSLSRVTNVCVQSYQNLDLGFPKFRSRIFKVRIWSFQSYKSVDP